MEREPDYFLPGYQDFDQHYSTRSQARTLPRYELYEDEKRLEIYDPVWGECTIDDWPGDEIYTQLYLNPLVKRSVGIEQLTLPRHFATMPGSTELPRFEHIFGSVVLTRKLIEKARAGGDMIDDREALTLQLRTFVSDLGHTAFSHLGDWLFQGYGGSEDQHDIELTQMLEEGGVLDVLRRHGFDPQDIVFPEIHDFVECPQPDLCIDRVDYGAREMERWLPYRKETGGWLRHFDLVDGQIVMNDRSAAREFGLKFALLATEHWGHPTHRLQLQLFGELVRSVAADAYLPIAGADLRHSRDALYAVDQEILAATRRPSETNYNLHAVMLDTARAARKIFTEGRERELEQFLGPVAGVHPQSSQPPYPHPLRSIGWMTEMTGLHPQNIEFIPVDAACASAGELARELSDVHALPYAFDLFLPPLKPRQVDPLFRGEGGNIRRLSEADPYYAALMAEQRAVQSGAYVARLYAAPDFVAKLRQTFFAIDRQWSLSLTQERVAPARRRELFRDMAAVALGHRMVSLHLY